MTDEQNIMKIAIVTEYYYPLLGGITEHVHHFALEAKKLGHEPVIITADAGRDPNIKEEVEVVRIGKSLPIFSNGSVARLSFGFNVGQKLRSLFRSRKFDVIHIHSPFVPMLPAMAQRYADTLTVATFHTHFASSGALRAFSPFIRDYFDALHGKIAVSRLCVESMGRYFKGEYKIIPNGVDTGKFHPKAEKIARFADGKMNIFFLSRLEPRNGLDYLIRAFVKIRRKRNDCRLIVGGDGPLMQYYRAIVPRELKDDVHFIGRINGARPSYFATADIFCFPVTKASFGITLLEAMASGRPSVAFSMPAFEGILGHKDHGILCGEPSDENLANALASLLDNGDERFRMGFEARRRAEDFAWDKVAKQVIEYYGEVVEDMSSLRRSMSSLR